ncbi:hypothetical protein MLD38_001935 [Melastoma candidum]|uniref:Uncharacterized protein n=1 Tax=Melastoma candidum TaxID=119954 RepID=A0ACB9SF82_9MYRT|nr:hypothetical protein MLD38_001935 [Melastoma candidum]
MSTTSSAVSALDSSNSRPTTSPDHHPTVIVVVIVLCGGVFLAFVVATLLFWFLKRRRKTKRTHEEIDVLHADKHRKVKEEIIKGPHGMEAVVVTVEDDAHVDGRIIKEDGKEKLHEGTLVIEPGQASS